MGCLCSKRSSDGHGDNIQLMNTTSTSTFIIFEFFILSQI